MKGLPVVSLNFFFWGGGGPDLVKYCILYRLRCLEEFGDSS